MFFLLGCGPGDHMDDDSMDTTEVTTTSTTLYYGNINNDTVVLLDTETMQLKEVINSNGVNPYEIAQALGNELYVINRSDYTIGILDTVTNTLASEISLGFYPRSISINLSDILLTSVNEPAAAVITSNTASQSYTDSAYVPPASFGGSNATGHPVWVDNNYFLLLDRTENTIELYEKNNYTPIDKLTTQSSVHHVMYKDGYYYGISEGKQNGVSPGVVKFSVANGKITLSIERLFSSLSDLPSDFTSTSWGAHHGAFHPTSNYIYVGSTEGNVDTLLFTIT
jgi:YVTN family beta-propeller protein